MSEAASTPINQGKPWLEDEILRLLQAVKRKESIQQIAETHRRTSGGIQSRLSSLAADYYYNDERPIEKIMTFTGLSKDQVLDAIAKRANTMKVKEKKKEQKAQSYRTPSINMFEPPKKDESVISLLTEIRDLLKHNLEKSEYFKP